MTHHTHILLPIVTSEDGRKCSPECPHHDYLWSCEMPDEDDLPSGWRCRIYDEQGESVAVKLNERHDACLAAERAARDERDVTIARLREREARVRALCEGETTYESIAPDVLAILDDDEKDGEG